MPAEQDVYADRERWIVAEDACNSGPGGKRKRVVSVEALL